MAIRPRSTPQAHSGRCVRSDPAAFISNGAPAGAGVEPYAPAGRRPTAISACAQACSSLGSVQARPARDKGRAVLGHVTRSAYMFSHIAGRGPPYDELLGVTVMSHVTELFGL